MVAFETLLLGIVFGQGTVRLAVGPPVAAVELRLDDAVVTVMHGPPWAAACEFGSNPLPHVLTAIGFDGRGREVARATQWVNIGRERVKVSATLERDSRTGHPVAVRPVWNTTEAAEPSSVVATLDGTPLSASDPRRIPLPPVNLSETHLVSIEVAFSADLHGRVDLALGGGVIESAESELTAVAVRLPPKMRFLDVRSVTAMFSLGSSRVRPIAVDAGRAEVVFVIGAGVRPMIRFIKELYASAGALDPGQDRASLISAAPARMIDPEGNFRDLFAVSNPVRLSRIGREVKFGTVMDSGRLPDEMIADAVAVAGAEAAGSNHRRAVVLVLPATQAHGGERRAQDRSSFQIPAVKAYLAALDVPLIVWSLDDGETRESPPAWGPAEDISTPHRLRKARAKLERELAAQRIVWFGGRLLPQRITLDPGAHGIQLAR